MLRGPVRAMCLLPNGGLCYAVGCVVVFTDKEYRERHRKRVLSLPTTISGMQLHASSKTVAIWGRCELWLLALSDERAGFEGEHRLQHKYDLDGWILRVAFVSDARLVVGLAEGGSFVLVERGLLRKVPYPIEGNIACFDCRNETVAIGSVFGETALITLDGQLLWKAAGRLCTIRIDCKRNAVIGGSDDGEISVWNLSTAALSVVNGNCGQIWDIVLLGDGFATCGDDGTVKVWNGTRLLREWKADGPSAVLCGVSIAGDHDLFLGCFDGTIRRLPHSGSATEICSDFSAFALAPNQTLTLGKDGKVQDEDGHALLDTGQLGKCKDFQVWSNQFVLVDSHGDLHIGGEVVRGLHVSRLFGDFAYSLQRSLIYSLACCKVISLPSEASAVTSLLAIDDVILCGTRTGQLVSTGAESGTISVCNDAITSLCAMDGSLFAASRNGSIYRFALPDMHLANFYRTDAFRTASGIEWMSVLDGRLVFAYFYDKNFVVKSGSFPRNDVVTLAEWHCGGNHRAWKCALFGDELRFGFVKDGRLFVHSLAIRCGIPRLIGGQWHAKVVRTACWLQHPRFATGSDDGTVALWDSQRGALLQRLDNIHRSTINAMCVCQGYLFSGGGRSEIYAFKLGADELVPVAHHFCAVGCSDDVRVICIHAVFVDAITLVFSLSDGSVATLTFSPLTDEFVVTLFKTMVQPRENCYVLCIGGHSRYLFLGWSNGGLSVCADGEIVLDSRIHEGPVMKLLFHESQLFTAGYDGKVQQIDLSFIACGFTEENNVDTFPRVELIRQFVFPAMGLWRNKQMLVVLTSDGAVTSLDSSHQIMQVSRTFVREATDLLCDGNSALVFGANGMQSVELTNMD